MTADGGARRALLRASLLLAIARAGVLRVTHGPAELLGASYPLAEFAFSPAAAAAAAYDVRAPLVIVERADWAADACPPTYRGGAALGGAVVVSVDADLARCSPEAYARAAAAAGAHGWLLFESARLAYDPQPGHARNLWLAGDARALAAPPVAADLTQRSAAPLVAALRAAAPVRARLRRGAADGAEPWDVERTGVGWSATRAWVCAGALLLVEVAAVRLYAFVRAEGLRAASLVQWLLLIELCCNGCRLALFASDPYLSTGRLPYQAADLLTGLAVLLGELTSALFLAHFIAAAARAGLGSTLLSARGACGLVTFVGAAVSYEIAIRAAPLAQAAAAVALTRLVVNTLLCPLSLVLAGTYAAVRVRAALGALPPAVLRALQRRVDAAVALHALSFGLSLALPWATVGAERRAPVVWAFYTVALGTSWAIVRTFAPPPSPTPTTTTPPPTTTPTGGDGGARDGRPRAPLASGPLERGAVWALAHAEGLARELVDRLDALRAARAAASPAADAPPSVDEKGGAPALAPHLLLGVSPAYLRAFARRHALGADAPTLSLGELARALTAASRRSLAEEARAAGEAAGGRPAVARATVIESHAQRMGFVKLLDALDEHVAMHALDRAETYCWLDVFSIRQHEIEADVAHIGEIERRIGRVALVLDPWDAPVALTRVWCLYEIVHCHAAEGAHARAAALSLTMAPSERGRFLRALGQDYAAARRAPLRFDARRADATVESDRVAIFELIARSFGAAGADDDDGMERFNALVRAALESALAAFSWSLAAPNAPLARRPRRRPAARNNAASVAHAPDADQIE